MPTTGSVHTNERINDQVGFGITEAFPNTDDTLEAISAPVKRICDRLFIINRESQKDEEDDRALPGFRLSVILEPGKNAVNGLHRLNKLAVVIDDYCREQGYALASHIQEVVPARNVLEAFQDLDTGVTTSCDWLILQQYSVVDVDACSAALNEPLEGAAGHLLNWVPLCEHLLERDRERQRHQAVAQLTELFSNEKPSGD